VCVCVSQFSCLHLDIRTKIHFHTYFIPKCIHACVHSASSFAFYPSRFHVCAHTQKHSHIRTLKARTHTRLYIQRTTNSTRFTHAQMGTWQQHEMRIPELVHETVEIDHMRDGHEDRLPLIDWAQMILEVSSSVETEACFRVCVFHTQKYAREISHAIR